MLKYFTSTLLRQKERQVGTNKFVIVHYLFMKVLLIFHRKNAAVGEQKFTLQAPVIRNKSLLS